MTRTSRSYICSTTQATSTYPPLLPLGASHAEEMNAIFGAGAVQGDVASSFPERLVEQAQRYWTAFVRHYAANAGLDENGTAWTAWTGA